MDGWNVHSYKHVCITSLFPLRKPTYPQSFLLIYGFLLDLWVSNLKEEEEKKNSAQYVYDGEDLGHPYIQSTCAILSIFSC